MTRVVKAGRITFAALSVPNYRRYISGQAISLVGTWMQMAAQSWLVLTLTGSATTLGVVIALQTLPVLLLGHAPDRHQVIRAVANPCVEDSLIPCGTRARSQGCGHKSICQDSPHVSCYHDQASFKRP